MAMRVLRSHTPMIAVTEQALCGLSHETLVDLVLFYQTQITDLKRERRALHQVIASQQVHVHQLHQSTGRAPGSTASGRHS